MFGGSSEYTAFHDVGSFHIFSETITLGIDTKNILDLHMGMRKHSYEDNFTEVRASHLSNLQIFKTTVLKAFSIDMRNLYRQGVIV